MSLSVPYQSCLRSLRHRAQCTRPQLFSLRLFSAAKSHSSARACQVQRLRAAATSTQHAWFAAQAVGEWDGVLVTYNAEGQPAPIPDRFVPDAFRDWDVQLYDWQTQCSTWQVDAPAAGAGSSPAMFNMMRRLMPTVGCEADAIAYEEDVHCLWHNPQQRQQQQQQQHSEPPVARCGSYASLPSSLSTSDSNVRVELCTVLNPAGAADGVTRVRVRAVVTLMRDWASKNAWRAMFVDLVRETYEGPYRGGVELSACAGNAKFSETPVVTDAQLAGPWVPVQRTLYAAAAGDGCLQLQGEMQGTDAASRLPAGGPPGAHVSKLQLPLGAQLGCFSTDHDDVMLELIVVQGSTKHVASCMYAAGRLSSVELGLEQRQA